MHGVSQARTPGPASRPVEPAALQPRTTRDVLLLVALLAIAVIASRASAFGNPFYSADDQLYVQFGRAIDHGQIPYVDIWDRKPIGLFLVFAATGLLGGDPIIASQIVAGLCVLATALLVHAIARSFASEWGSRAAALAFIVSLPMFKGAAAQAQLFYEPLIALAALIVVRTTLSGARPRLRSAAAVMLLCGLAFTIKQTVIVESAFLGCWLWFAQRGRGLLVTARDGLLLLLAFAAPTLASFAYFWSHGLLATYLDSSFLSVFHKGGDRGWASLGRALACLLLITPLLACAVSGLVIRLRAAAGRWSGMEIFLQGWAVAALIGVCLIPRFYAYYPIPLLLPLSISAATLFARARTGPLFLMCLAALVVAHGDVLRFRESREARDGFTAMSAYLNSHAADGCLFVADGPGLFYDSNRNPCRTPYRFPDHLSLPTEAASIGSDPARAVRDILAQRPATIVLRVGTNAELHNPITWPIIEAALRRDYHPDRRFSFPVNYGPQTVAVWLRNNSTAATASRPD